MVQDKLLRYSTYRRLYYTHCEASTSLVSVSRWQRGACSFISSIRQPRRVRIRMYSMYSIRLWDSTVLYSYSTVQHVELERVGRAYTLSVERDGIRGEGVTVMRWSMTECIPLFYAVLCSPLLLLLRWVIYTNCPYSLYSVYRRYAEHTGYTDTYKYTECTGYTTNYRILSPR